MARKGIPEVPQEIYYAYPAIPTPGDLFLSDTAKELVSCMLLEIIEGIDGERRKGLGPGLVYKITKDRWNKSVVEEVMRQLRFRGWKSERRHKDLVISAL